MSQFGNCRHCSDEHEPSSGVADVRSQLQHRKSRSCLWRVPKAEETFRVVSGPQPQWCNERKCEEEGWEWKRVERSYGSAVGSHGSPAGEYQSSGSLNGVFADSNSARERVGVRTGLDADGTCDPFDSYDHDIRNDATAHGTARGTAATGTAGCHICRLQPCQGRGASNDVPCEPWCEVHQKSSIPSTRRSNGHHTVRVANEAAQSVHRYSRVCTIGIRSAQEYQRL